MEEADTKTSMACREAFQKNTQCPSRVVKCRVVGDSLSGLSCFPHYGGTASVLHSF